MTRSCAQNSSGSLIAIPARPSDERIEQLERLRYDDYLATPEWKALRDWVLAANGNRCRLCNYDKGLHVHHRYYCLRGTETLDTLTPLCQPCHAMFHKNGKLYNPRVIHLRINDAPKPPKRRRNPEQTRDFQRKRAQRTRTLKEVRKQHVVDRPCQGCGTKPCKKYSAKGGKELCATCYAAYLANKRKPIKFEYRDLSPELDREYAEIVKN